MNQHVQDARNRLHDEIAGVMMDALKTEANIHLTPDEYDKVKMSLLEVISTWRIAL